MGPKDRRLKLSDKLHDIFDYPTHIYYQPPESVKLEYPAIVYYRQKISTVKADNRNYLKYDRFVVTYIHKDKDDPMLDKILDLDRCAHDRQFNTEDLYHDVFTITVI